MSCTWQTETVELMRGVLLDLEEPYKFSETKLTKLLARAAQLVLNEVAFDQAYVVDLVNNTITPDPAEVETRNESFLNLMILKAGCMLDYGNARKSATQAIDIQDGSSRISLKGAMSGFLIIMEKGFCKLYDEAKFAYQAGLLHGFAGAAILGPFRYAFSYHGLSNRDVRDEWLT